MLTVKCYTTHGLHKSKKDLENILNQINMKIPHIEICEIPLNKYVKENLHY